MPQRHDVLDDPACLSRKLPPFRLGPLQPVDGGHHGQIAIPPDARAAAFLEHRLDDDQSRARGEFDGATDVGKDLEDVGVCPVVEAPLDGVDFVRRYAGEEVACVELCHAVRDVVEDAVRGGAVKLWLEHVDYGLDLEDGAFQARILAQEGSDEVSSAGTNVTYDGIAELCPVVVCQHAGSLSDGSCAEGLVEFLLEPFLFGKVREDGLVGAICDLGGAAGFICRDGLREGAGGVVEFLAVEGDPAVPLGPVVLLQEEGGFVVGVCVCEGVVGEDVCVVVEGAHDLLEAEGLEVGFLGEEGGWEGGLVGEEVGDVVGYGGDEGFGVEVGCFVLAWCLLVMMDVVEALREGLGGRGEGLVRYLGMFLRGGWLVVGGGGRFGRPC